MGLDTADHTDLRIDSPPVESRGKEMGEKVRVALVGYGYWGPNYARVLSELPEAQIVAISELSPQLRQRAQARHSQAEVVESLSEVLKRKDVDAVVISTPATTHYELASAALKAGRHVLVEKPLSLHVEQCEELGELAKRAGRVLLVAHTFLYNAGIRKMKECMSASDFGNVYYLHSTRTNLGPIRQDVNAVWDLAPHDVSIFAYLLDQTPEWVSAVGARVLGNSREDVAFISLGYADGVLGNIHVSWADPNKVREVVAVGSGRRVVFDDLSDLERVRIYEKGVAVNGGIAESYGEFKLLVRDGDIISPRIPPSEPLKNQCAEFLNAVRNVGRVLSDARFATGVVRTLLAVDASMRAHGAAQEVMSGVARSA